MNTRLSENYISSLLPRRAADGNKGTFGRVLLVCGSGNMRGAAALSLLGAIRSGAGLVTLASTREVIDALSSNIYEALWLDREKESCISAASKASAVGIGCGMGVNDTTRDLVFALLDEETDVPLVIDADGINVLKGNAAMLKSAHRPILLTPHPLEFSRLSGISVAEIQSAREKYAKEFAAEYGVTLLLKGKDTVITDGEKVFVNLTGSNALAKGGSGDVLTGMICAFLAQGCCTIDAAAIAAYCHGMAGERLAKVYSEYGVMPSDIPAEAAKILCEISK